MANDAAPDAAPQAVEGEQAELRVLRSADVRQGFGADATPNVSLSGGAPGKGARPFVVGLVVVAVLVAAYVAWSRFKGSSSSGGGGEPGAGHEGGPNV